MPPGFNDEILAEDFQSPTGMRIAPDGRLFIFEKRGLVWVHEGGGVLQLPFADLVDEVGNAADRGFLDMALDPNFSTNGYVYFAYTVDETPGEPDDPPNSISFTRVTRYTAVGNSIDPASRHIVLGHDASDGPPQCSYSHASGRLAFAEDGSLLVSHGEGANPEFVDGGQQFDCDGLYPDQDVGALRAQSLDTLGGKVLRIDPVTGLGFPDNPFFDGDPASLRSRVWALGFRNPFRFALRPDSGPTGTLYVADVGWGDWEEVNVVSAGGNFGWPCFEGPLAQPDYQSDSHTASICAGLPQASVTEPAISWHHEDPGNTGFTGSAATGITFYTGNSFPAAYHGALFFADYTENWLKVATVDAADNVLSIQDFATDLGGPVDLQVDPATGDLLYVSISADNVHRIRYGAGNYPPQAFASATPSAGTSPLGVQLSSNGSFDPDGDPITFLWDFGDDSGTSSAANPFHIYTTEDVFSATLTIQDDHGHVAISSVTINTRDRPPGVSVTWPPNLYAYEDDEIVQLEASANDPDGDPLTWSWEVQLVHNSHLHPEQMVSTSPVPPPFQLVAHGDTHERHSYRAIVTVTDDSGLEATDSILMIPTNAAPNDPPSASFSVTPVLGTPPLLVSVNATSSSDPNGDYLFYSWDFGDGSSASTPITTHVYQGAGSYEVALRVTDVVGASDTQTAVVDVQEIPAVPVRVKGATALWFVFGLLALGVAGLGIRRAGS